MNAVDTSVVVAAFASWHEHHEAARQVIDAGPAIVDHCLLEAYSTLTRLPPPHRVAPPLAAMFLIQRFPGKHLSLPTGRRRDLVTELAPLGIAGGATYDALIAATARAHDATLLTLDARASQTYTALGCRYRLLS